jgi:hypothetical protein
MMRIGRKGTIVLALAVAGAVAVAGVAMAAATSSFTFSVSPNKVPKKKFKPIALKTDLKTSYTNPGNGNPGGAVERTQIYLDKNFKINPKAAKRCAASSLSGQTMAGAMAACSKARVGNGTAQAVNPATKKTVFACALLFNGKPQGGRPTLQILTRVDITGKQFSCSDPAHNTGGQTTILLTGVLKPASGKFGQILDVSNITKAAAFPLTDFNTKIKKGNYITARCKSSSKKWNLQVTWTYNDKKKTTAHQTQKCKVKK